MAKNHPSIPNSKAAKNRAVGQAQAMLQQALQFHQHGQLAQAQALYENVLKLQPMHFDALNLLAQLAYQCSNYQRAFELLAKAIATNPKVADSYSNIGLVLQALNRLDEALASYDKALVLNPNYADAYNNRGNVLKELKRLDEALASYDKALTLNPRHAEAYNNRGNVLQDLKRLDEALVSYDKALALNSRYAEALNNRGNVLVALWQLDEALVSYDKALALNPCYADAYNNRGNALQDLNRLDEALASYSKALVFDPDYALAHNNRGNALTGLKRLDEALASYDKALALKPDYAEAYNNRGNALVGVKRLDEALVDYDRGLALEPGYEFLLGTLLHTKMKLCNWEGLSEILKNYEMEISQAKRVTVPFPALSLLDSPELHKQASMTYVGAKFRQNDLPSGINKRTGTGKICVGYYSADFHNHATAYLIAELFEAHDKEKFEFYGFSFGPDRQDEMRKRVSLAFDKYIDVRNKSDREIAWLSREMGIDIAIDLKGFTQDSRFGIFVERCAPIQVNYLGYPGTMGSGCIDYVIADRTVIPEDRQSDFSEKVVYLPHSYQVNDSKRKISERVFTKEELGLPVSGFVFCSFNTSYKILPATFDGWMRILKAVEGSVLWLLDDNATATKNLRKEAAASGVDSNRLIFAQRMPLDEHLARHRLADLFLDTLPCNAHTTASDALWAGLPVLTCAGKSFASRVAASLLNAIELPELVTSSQEEYETKAIELAKDTAKFSELKRKLERNRLATPLFDAEIFAKHIESAYELMYARHQSGLPPERIVVQA